MWWIFKAKVLFVSYIPTELIVKSKYICSKDLELLKPAYLRGREP